MARLTLVYLVSLLLFKQVTLFSQELKVSSIEELKRVLTSLSHDKTVITLQDGNYKLNKALKFESITGPSSRLIIKALNPGKVKLYGEGFLKFSNSHNIELNGLIFKHTKGVEFEACKNIKIKNCHFNLKVIDDKVHWLTFKRDSSNLLVEHCDFGPRKVVGKSLGSYISAGLGGNVRHVRIANNYFYKRERQNWNGGESIYLHGSGIWAIYGLIENNLFEECNGEHELIGIKSHKNIIRNNSFVNCQGAVSVRDGSYNLIYDNLFISDSKNRLTGGARLFGKYNVFANNYLYQIKTPLEAMWAENSPPYHENGFHSSKVTFNYGLSKNNFIAFNTFEHCENIVTIFKKAHLYEPKVLFNSSYGSFRKEQWKKSVHKTLVNNTYQPNLAPEKWTFFGNKFKQPTRIIDSVFINGANYPIKEKGFEWHSNFHNGFELTYDKTSHQFQAHDNDQLKHKLSKQSIKSYPLNKDLLKLIERTKPGSSIKQEVLSPSDVGISFRGN